MAKKYKYFIGIDVSRNKLDLAVVMGNQFLLHKEIPNEHAAVFEFITELKTTLKLTIGKSLFCLENTGIYANRLVESLRKLKANIVVENPLTVKNSFGLLRGKYDKIDAIRIANYAFKYQENLRLLPPKRPLFLELVNLFALRNRLSATQVALKNPLHEQTAFGKKNLVRQSVQLCQNSLDAIAADISAIEEEINRVINEDERFKRLVEVITSIPAVGRITAIQIILATNEFKDINEPKKFACYAGIAPFVSESGTIKGRGKISNIANKKMKATLHLCAMVAVRCKIYPEYKIYYERKTREGKPKMSVLNALRNKLVLRIFACVNEDRFYKTDYKSRQKD